MSLAVLTLIVLACLLGPERSCEIPQNRFFFVFYVLISAPCQEILTRGFLVAVIEQAGISGATVKVILPSVAFSFFHVLYRDLLLAATLLIGIVWGLIYVRHRNLLPIIGSHALLGSIAIATGII